MSIQRFVYYVCAMIICAGLIACALPIKPQLISSSEPLAVDSPKLRFIGETTLPHRMEFQGTTVGGLSGIDYDAKRGIFYLIADDRSDINAARFYTARIPITADTLGKTELLSMVTLKKSDGAVFGSRKDDAANVPDPEAIRYRPDTDTLLWTSEGDKKLLLDPFLREMKLDGSFVRNVATSSMFAMQKGNAGSRENATYEGLSLSADGRSVWVAMEGARYEDGATPSFESGGASIRLTQYDVASAKSIRQIAYAMDAIPARPMPPTGFADNGVPEILMLDTHRMLVLERSYAQGVGNSLRVYVIDTRDSADVINIPALSATNHSPVRKRLLINFDSLNLAKLDNTEGMSFGPRLANGNRTLIFVSDDNFNRSQITQFLAFELIE
jgi:hypothetical protein